MVSKRLVAGTDFHVSVLGFGAWGIGGLTDGQTSYGKTVDSVSLATIETAVDLGVNFFDTANVYGDGHSEKLLGKVLSNGRDRFIISSKVGLKKHNEPLQLTKNNIVSSVNSSLQRLKTDYLDILHLHEVELEQLEENTTVLETLLLLKESGKIRTSAISLRNPLDLEKAYEKFHFRIFQTNVNLMDLRLIKSGFLQNLKASDLSVVCRTPMGLGFLPHNFPKDIVFPPGDHRNRFSREVIHHWIDRANAVMKALGLDDLNDTRSRAALALRFCISLPHTVSVIPGIMCPNDVLANAEGVETGRLSDKEMSVALKCFLDWER